MDVRHVPVAKLIESPTNPRRLFGDLSGLADSLKAQGVLQPLVARDMGGELELVFGHRRLRAAKLAGLKTVPVHVREMGDVEVAEAQATENAQREDVHPLEMSAALQRLVDLGFSVDQVAARIGLKRTSVFNLLKLRALSEPARKACLAGRLSYVSAVAVARVDGGPAQADALRKLEAAEAKKGGPLTTRELLRLMRPLYTHAKGKRTKTPKPATPEADTRAAVELLLGRIQTAVERRAGLDDAEVRLLLTAHGMPAEPLRRLRGARLRATLVTTLLSPWLASSEARRLAARVYGVEAPG